MKHRIKIRRRDGVRQRYWIGRKLKKNYGSKMFREQIKKELYGNPERRRKKLLDIQEFIKNDPELYDVEFIENPKIGSKKIIHVIEKHPYLLKDIRGSDILLYKSARNVPPGFSKSKEGIIGIDEKLFNIELSGIDPLTRSRKVYTPEHVLKHEAAHLKSDKILRDIGFNEKEEYDPVRERALSELASEYASHTDIRKERLPQRLVDEMGFKFLSKVEKKPNLRS